MQRIILGVDLGNDNVKFSCSYQENKETKTYYFLNDNNDLIKSLGYFSKTRKTWFFADDVMKETTNNFSTVIQMKDLFNLLISNETKDLDLYNNANFFPIFNLSNKYKQLSYSNLVVGDTAFECNYTPKEVCTLFLEQMFYKVILPKIKEFGFQQDQIDVVITYPIKKYLCSNFIDEITKIYKNDIEVNVKDPINLPKAIGLFAVHNKLLNYKKNNRTLIVDIGATNSTLVKLITKNGVISVDSVEAHEMPIDIGGNNFDISLRKIVESKISSRGSLGSSSADEQVVENGSFFEQFILMDAINSAKKNISNDRWYDSVFSNGVPITTERDVTIEVKVKREEYFERTKKHIDEISDFLLRELNRPNNEIDNIILTGGCSNSYLLQETIKETILNKFPSINFIKFKNENETTLSASIGASIYGLNIYNYNTVTSYSYGIIGHQRNTKIDCLAFLVAKGSIIQSSNEFVETFDVYESDYQFNVYSSSVEEDETKLDVVKRKFGLKQINEGAVMKIRHPKYPNNFKEYIKRGSSIIVDVIITFDYDGRASINVRNATAEHCKPNSPHYQYRCECNISMSNLGTIKME